MTKKEFTAYEVAVLIEDLRSQFKVFGENLLGIRQEVSGLKQEVHELKQRVDAIVLMVGQNTEDINMIKEDMSQVKKELITIKKELRQKVDRKEFLVVREKVLGH